MTLSGANTETGTTTLSAGTLRATSNATAMGALTAALQLNGGSLQLANTSGANLAFRTTGTTTVGGSVSIVSDVLSPGAGTSIRSVL